MGRAGMFITCNLAFIALSTNLYTTELNTICNSNQTCTIDKTYPSIENSIPFSVTTIKIGENYQYNTITTFTNTSTITSTDDQTFRFGDKGSSVRGNIVSFINYGTISGGIYIGNVEARAAIGAITNYSEMRGIWVTKQQNLTINNQGTIKTNAGAYNGKAAHFFFASVGNLTIENYLIKIIESQSEFNGFAGYTNKTDNKNSHLIIGGGGSISFSNNNAKIIIDFDTNNGFELGKEYSIAKLVTNQNGDKINAFDLPFSHLMLKNRDFYNLTQSGDSFIVNTASSGGGFSGGVVINTEITESHKANVKAMNNFFASSNAIMFSNQRNKTKHTTQKQVIRKARKVSNLFYGNDFVAPNSQNLLKINETFFYDSVQIASNNANTRAIRLRRLPSKNQYRLNQSINRNNQAKTKTTIRPANQAKDTYHFILTPFVNHNHYFEAGNYNLSGLDYGFVSAFSGKVASNNSLGAHLGFSYGNLKDKNDKLFSVNNINIMLGLNYKLDLIWDMYLKARGDFFYFINEITSEQIAKTKADNIGFGVSVAYGKDFDFGNAGILGAEIGIDYKALNTKDLSIKSAFDNTNMQDYERALYHLLYADLGINYNKYFGAIRLSVGAGIRGNLTTQLAKSKISISGNIINVLLDNDKIFGYANVGVSYALNAKSFDMEFSLSYLGSFGNRAMSNGGGFEWRITW